MADGGGDNELGKWGDMTKKETVLIAVAENGYVALVFRLFVRGPFDIQSLVRLF